MTLDVIHKWGSTIDAASEIVGLSPDLTLHTGNDENIITPEPPGEESWTDPHITSANCVRLADHMIQRWQEFREKHAALAAAAASESASSASNLLNPPHNLLNPK